MLKCSHRWHSHFHNTPERVVTAKAVERGDQLTRSARLGRTITECQDTVARVQDCGIMVGDVEVSLEAGDMIQLPRI